MRVFVITRRGQGTRPWDFCHAEDGEMATFETDLKGDTIAFVGLDTRMASTTAMIAETEMDVAAVAELHMASEERAGRKPLIINVYDRVREIDRIGSHYPVGTILERNVEAISPRRMHGAAQAWTADRVLSNINGLRGADPERYVLSVTAEAEPHRCGDCGQPAFWLVTERDGRTWHYCGTCEVG